jgi:CheY-like chemotaxis protein
VHVLVVDDEVPTLKATEAVLLNAGHTVCWAQTGLGALDLLRTEPIDLVLLDMMLPDMTGWEIARIKLADPRIASIPVIVLSGLSADEIRNHAGRNPMASVFLILTKPLDVAMLLTAIDHIGELRSIERPHGSSGA